MGQVQVWQMRLVVVWVARQTVGNLGFVRLQGKFWVHLASCMDVHVSMCQAESAGQLLGLIPKKKKNCYGAEHPSVMTHKPTSFPEKGLGQYSSVFQDQTSSVSLFLGTFLLVAIHLVFQHPIL